MSDPLDGFENPLDLKENNKRRKIKGMTWRDDETEILVKSYAEEIATNPKMGAYRNLDSYVNIMKKMKAFGYNRTAEQARTKMKHLRRGYYVARRGTESDRRACYLYEDLDELFRNSGYAQSVYSKNPVDSKPTLDMDEEETQQSSDASAYVAIETPQVKRRSCARRQNYISKNDIDDYEDDPLIVTNSKRPRRIINDRANNYENQLNLVHFVSEQLDKQRDHISEQLDKQREHQKEITKTFTDAMTAQFTQFSNLITNFMQQMYNTQTNQKQQTHHKQSATQTVANPFENGDMEPAAAGSYFRAN